jgi:hypothetical protein
MNVVLTSHVVKTQAKLLKEFLFKECGFEISTEHCLDVIAKMWSIKNWEIMSEILINLERRH